MVAGKYSAQGYGWKASPVPRGMVGRQVQCPGVWLAGKYSAQGYGLKASTVPEGMVARQYSAQGYGWQASTVAKGMVGRQVQWPWVWLAGKYSTQGYG
ncbi:hypothetical protein DPMN_053561 [Dreissena polymorpha]|uniref:Uncharacterized protein n=1 Tax=Dreissena polymorpha TaxID=45954 RepID=A0A9D4CMC0_DREPO|nr:hypothetical protein DPMN_053561 [Dreissena polymorpha]